MKGWGWFLLGAVAGAAALWAGWTARSDARVRAFSDSLAVVRSESAARATRVARLGDSLAQLGPVMAAAEAARIRAEREAGVHAGAVKEAAAAEAKADSALQRAASTSDSLKAMTAARVAADARADGAVRQVQSLGEQLAATDRLLAGSRDSTRLVLEQLGTVTVDRDAWRRLAERSDSLLHRLSPPRGKLLGFLPLPRLVVAGGVTQKLEPRILVGFGYSR